MSGAGAVLTAGRTGEREGVTHDEDALTPPMRLQPQDLWAVVPVSRETEGMERHTYFGVCGDCREPYIIERLAQSSFYCARCDARRALLRLLRRRGLALYLAERRASRLFLRVPSPTSNEPGRTLYFRGVVFTWTGKEWVRS